MFLGKVRVHSSSTGWVGSWPKSPLSVESYYNVLVCLWKLNAVVGTTFNNQNWTELSQSTPPMPQKKKLSLRPVKLTKKITSLQNSIGGFCIGGLAWPSTQPSKNPIDSNLKPLTSQTIGKRPSRNLWKNKTYIEHHKLQKKDMLYFKRRWKFPWSLQPKQKDLEKLVFLFFWIRGSERSESHCHWRLPALGPANSSERSCSPRKLHAQKEAAQRSELADLVWGVPSILSKNKENRLVCDCGLDFLVGLLWGGPICGL